MMTRRNVSEEWRLEEGETPQERWTLEPAEQNAISQWQLEGAEQPATDWQPVDYEREPRAGGGNWILPALVGVALVAVVAYVAWIGLGRMGLFGPTTPATQPSNELASAPTTAATATAATAIQPTNTPEPPTPTSEPTATATVAPSPTATQIPLVPLQSVFVNTVGGVNARREPNLQAEVIRILPQGEEFLVNADQTDWVQVALPERQLGWVAAEFVERRSTTVTVEDANRRREAVGLPALSVSTPGAGASPAITDTAIVTDAITSLPATAPATSSFGISVTVNITGGLNAREAPNLGAIIVRQLDFNSSFTALARSEDSQWVQVRLPEGTTAWVSAPMITPSGDINTLPTSSGLPLPASSPGVTTTTPVTVPVTQVVSGVTASVSSLSGANARATPDRNTESLQVLPFDSVLPVVGRSADNEWIQVTLEEGRLAWVLLESVQISADVATLPVVNP